ncbi:MAG: hypothetical protein M0P13_11585 [Fibrobacteraceae bacterium]|nr:hypothetical protein [Fibrobacteraceae bacterium]
MLNKFITYLFSAIFLVGSFKACTSQFYHGLWIDLYGYEAIIASIFLFFISLFAISNLIHPWTKWFKPKDWPLLLFCAICIEVFVRYLFVFAEFLKINIFC